MSHCLAAPPTERLSESHWQPKLEDSQFIGQANTASVIGTLWKLRDPQLRSLKIFCYIGEGWEDGLFFQVLLNSHAANEPLATAELTQPLG